MHRLRLTAIALATMAAPALLVGCGSEGSANVKAPTYAELRAGLAGSPAELTALHSQMGKVIDSGKQGFQRQLASLRGLPVVVNVWASWCGPCRYEFPVLGQASLQLGKSTGFIGIASRDTAASAQSFLERHPVGYPSWNDADGATAGSLGIASGLPATVFFDRAGNKQYVHQGPYDSVAALAADIRRYADGP